MNFPMMGRGYTGGNYQSGGLFNVADFLGNVGLGKSQMAMAAGIPSYPGGGGLPTSSLSPNFGQQIGGGSAGFDMSKLAGLLGGMSGGTQKPQAQQGGKGSQSLDPLYLVKQYARQTPATQLMPLGLLG
jgi:hypothetical protein